MKPSENAAPSKSGAFKNLNITTSLTPPSSPARPTIPLATHRGWAGAIGSAAADLTAIAVDTANACGPRSRAHRAAVAARQAIDMLRLELDMVAVHEHAAVPGVTDVYHGVPVFVASRREA